MESTEPTKTEITKEDLENVIEIFEILKKWRDEGRDRKSPKETVSNRDKPITNDVERECVA